MRVSVRLPNISCEIPEKECRQWCYLHGKPWQKPMCIPYMDTYTAGLGGEPNIEQNLLLLFLQIYVKKFWSIQCKKRNKKNFYCTGVLTRA